MPRWPRSPPAPAPGSPRQQCADVLIYLLLIAEQAGIDLEEAVRTKLVKNAAKYPVNRSYGSSRRSRTGAAGKARTPGSPDREARVVATLPNFCVRQKPNPAQYTSECFSHARRSGAAPFPLMEERQHLMPFGAEALAAGGVRFRLWAPGVAALRLRLDEAQEMPAAAGGGWFELTVAAAGAGSRYCFRLPDGLLVPQSGLALQPGWRTWQLQGRRADRLRLARRRLAWPALGRSGDLRVARRQLYAGGQLRRRRATTRPSRRPRRQRPRNHAGSRGAGPRRLGLRRCPGLCPRKPPMAGRKISSG